MATLNRRKLLQEDNLKKVFEMFDKDKSGTIEPNELRIIF